MRSLIKGAEKTKKCIYDRGDSYFASRVIFYEINRIINYKMNISKQDMIIEELRPLYKFEKYKYWTDISLNDNCLYKSREAYQTKNRD